MPPEPSVERVFDLPGLIRKKSHFLFGPRQTGKSFLIRHTLPGVRLYDLLDHATYLALSQHPGRIAEELTAADRVVRSEEHTSELQSRPHLVCRLLLVKKNHYTHGSRRRLSSCTPVPAER